jgi:hypothetical protein
VIGRRRLAAAALVPAALAVLAASATGARPRPAHAFALAACLATGAGLPPDADGPRAWARRDLAARTRACADAERAHRDRARWETAHQVIRERAQVLDTAARFRSSRARAGLDPKRAGGPDPAPSRLPPCARPDAPGECTATPEQILYQIQRSRAAAGTAAAPGPR